ncbi:methyl-accepting chemotaxis protein [Psychrosphaera sp. B3R10]|uniref:Methyl-accepting chemotaxis protein n=1 Tax=Psychrosphaera algicola TaxID=3023714 RepID=A0ABT5FI13_9GAMM|nr:MULTISPECIES: methyl-accepting chemotaxis protein [unclassified Psychrosphaera]MBU2881540.1 methyl-accepting chemotaxis protein [Psychrosphaera sp. I2R16]MBU2991205.1 methyl-accepting chemotaxis protein [Psychrosphaera sp. B3R10]MDC2890831.1 methyl-accepting chemotaxis protein [Psychrosphaera sp. G1-22]MDO6719464.1 methyl-accepting chemotaxis protein [Psychrosphaera sp. 1_MG-2023]
MNLTVAMRVIGGFAITSVLILGLGAVSVTTLNGISDSTQDVNKVSVPAMEASAKLQQHFLLLSKTTLLDYYASNYAETEQSVNTFKAQAADFETDLNLLKGIVSNTSELANKLPNVTESYSGFKDTAFKLFESKHKILEYRDNVASALEETEYAADDAATYLLDFIDINNLKPTDDATKNISQLESTMVSLITTMSDISKEAKKQNVETIIKELAYIQERSGTLLELIKADVEKNSFEGFSDIEDQLEAVNELLNSPKAVHKLKLGWLDQITLTDTLLETTNKKILDGLDQLEALQSAVKTTLNETTNNVTNDVNEGVNISYGVIVFSVIASVFIAWQTVIRVTRPLAEVNRVLNVVATGDLTERLDDSNRDEFGELATNCNKLIESLRELINGIVNRSNQLATASEQTSMVVKESTIAINDQRSQVEQAATATTEMSSTSSSVMERAKEALADIKHADEEAERVKQISDTNKQTIMSLAGEIEQASSVINQVNHHSAAIGGILDVIRGIAEQTNLLALNAAIEAARAGEQGRGFAVVADEVRSLASKTQESTEEIQNMIEQLQSGSKSAVTVMNNSKTQAELCVTQTEQATIALDGITDSVHQANDMSEQIVIAANEQYQVSSEISERLESIVAIAEQTAAGAVQTDQSSQEVARLAEELRLSVDQFRL